MKHAKIVMSVLALTILITGSFAFTSKSFHKFAATDYDFNTAVTPSSTTVIVSGNYTQEARVCPLPRQKYCAITIDPIANPGYVNADGTLNFSNTTLNSTVSSNFNAAEGTVVNGVTFHRRSN